MASITTRANGGRFIQFVDADGTRRIISLGRKSKRDAAAIKVKVEALADAKLTGHAPPRDVALWVQSLDDAMHTKLAKVELVGNRALSTVIEFVDRYIASRDEVKPATATVWRRTRSHLLAFFGTDRALRDVTAGDAKDFRRYLLSGPTKDRPKKRKLAEDTVRRTSGIAKQFFADALDRGLIERNPFHHREIPTATGAGDKSREFFVSCELAQQVIDILPDAQWRLMFALARYGGLRCPSEVLSLRWGDIDWERRRMIVTSPKTEHHDGGESRAVPIFPELRPFLDECYDLADEGTEFVITRYRKLDSNYGVLLTKRLRQAGLPTWPKPFQNLRSTRETELAESFPIHVVCQWIGNSQMVAAKHYLQVTEDHFAAATECCAQHEAQQSGAEMGGKGPQGGMTGNEKTPANAGACDGSRELAGTADGRYRT
ncbi:MAG: phage integrase SAM-like domain-containing protein [Planctomycetaceae bacterium]|nr:phage integrase SAM-like domain-containing protein [Planctomycetaceae bacterium]